MANPVARFETSAGNISIELFADKSPVTVENFVQYVKDGFFAGTIFHRVIPNFMIQGGGMEPGLKQKEGRKPIKNEADNGVKNERGTIAMARTMDPDSASSQFFINLKDNDFLNFKSKDTRGWGYCAFGKVIEGMETVDAIAEVETGSRPPHDDVPKTDVLIRSASIVE
ncbi:MAG: peptidyl-prolyl cis-trans isomerase [Spirochaetes bacterium]|nr:peptidyl-prolyl cis-trans isomerase [Spirochaetota bacterium]MBU0954142.1 peptidyl-prolyl cis-trans isomerase [Spirochaetota bacterium]